MRKQKLAIVNVYDLSDDLEKYDVLRFNQENEKWLDFVCACRKGDNIYRGYDIIIGAVANDDVFKTIVVREQYGHRDICHYRYGN